jgi:hypothetical protein
VTVFTLVLQCREEPVVTEFMFSGVDALLMKRFQLCPHFVQEQILYAFLAISGGSRKATQAVFERFILRYSPVTFSGSCNKQFNHHTTCGENFRTRPGRDGRPRVEWRAGARPRIANCWHISLRRSRCLFFSNLGLMVDDPRIEAFTIESRIFSILGEFLSVSTQKSWKGIVNGITQVKNHIDGNPFQHSLFEGMNAFYATFCELHDHPRIEAYNTYLYVSIVNWLELLDERWDADEQQFAWKQHQKEIRMIEDEWIPSQEIVFGEGREN